jgi:hypothetical protein
MSLANPTSVIVCVFFRNKTEALKMATQMEDLKNTI